MKKLIYSLSAALILLLLAFGPASRNITGLVTDSRNTPLPGVSVTVKGSTPGVSTDAAGKYSIQVPDGKSLVFTFLGYEPQEVSPGKSNVVNIVLKEGSTSLDEIVITGYGVQTKRSVTSSVSEVRGSANAAGFVGTAPEYRTSNTESYNGITENMFYQAKETPLSTFGIDVDAASYSNIRRFVNNGQTPPVDAVRIEEMINYFTYDYPQPDKNQPFSVNTEISSAPWNNQHRLVRIGLQGRIIPTENLPASNLVFLIDVSGSMDAPNRLPLVQSSLRALVDQLRTKDKVAIVVYAGAAGLVLPSTKCDDKQKIKDAINVLRAGGSTAGGAGIKLAYKIAQENFIKEGNNRVILATDGDFNVGASSDKDMQTLIEEKRESGVFLTVLGFGMGNYKDSKMETLADKGNGNYAYIDNFTEARKVLINEFGGTLFTIAKDVKLQIEFNPAKVQAYRLIGYENRLLNKEDFNNDKKDAGELGSGHTVTALYEVIPTGVKSQFLVDELKYQKENKEEKASTTNELFTVKLRYKEPDGNASKLIEKPVVDMQIPWNKTSDDFRFASAVAGYGMLLRKSEFVQQTTYANVIDWLSGGLGKDSEGYRAELLKMVKSSQIISKDLITSSGK